MKRKLSFVSLALVISLLSFVFVSQPAAAMGEISEGSGIAGIVLEGLSREEASDILNEAVTSWQSEEVLIAESDYEVVEIPRHLFNFNIDATLNALDEQTKRTWKNLFRKTKNVMLPLEVTISEKHKAEIDWPENMAVDETLNKFLIIASHLESGQVVIEYKADAVFEETVLAEVELIIPDELSAPVVERLAQELNQTTLESESVFSFVDVAYLPNGIEDVNAELSFVASGLYQLALQTHLEVVERHQSEKVPEYTDPGLEARINKEKALNLLIYNENAKSYTIYADIIDRELQMKIATIGSGDSASFRRMNITEIEPRTIYRYQYDLAPGQEIVETEGTPGLQLEVYQDKRMDGERSRIRVSKDFYPPEHRVILSSTKEEVELPETDLSSLPDAITDLLPNQSDRTDDGLSDGSDDVAMDLMSESISEGMELAVLCEGDAVCEEALGATTTERLIAACFNDATVNQEGTEVFDAETAKTVEFCDYVYTMFFLSLFNLSADDATTEKNPEKNSENIDEVVVK